VGAADWVPAELMGHILAALTPENALALRVSLRTGLRIDDVLSLKTADILKGNRFTISEMKTHKHRRVYLPELLRAELLTQAGRYYVFEHRLDETRHRTRQAVNKDLARAAEAFRVPAAVQISPHSCRKIYAVNVFEHYGNVRKVQELLNHSGESVTILYCLAEQVYNKKAEKRVKKARNAAKKRR
jgi:integrase